MNPSSDSINKYLPAAVLYFFLNGFLLPVGLLYTALLTPLLLVWVWRYRNLRYFGLYFLWMSPFVLVHWINGVESGAFYGRSVALSFTVLVFCIAFHQLLCFCNRLGDLYKKILLINGAMVVVALTALFIPSLTGFFWNANTLSLSNHNILRLKMLTYEPSYYSLLFAPIALYYVLKAFHRELPNPSVYLLLTLVPLALSLSFGVILGLAISLLVLFGLHARRILSGTENLRYFAGAVFLLVTSLLVLFVVFPENIFSRRIENILAGRDSSVNGRTIDSFILSLDIARKKNLFWGAGFGQVKLAGLDFYRRFYHNSGLTIKDVAIPNSIGDLLATLGLAGVALKLFLEGFFFLRSAVWSNYYRLGLFLFIFAYQFTGSFISNIAEYVIWILAFRQGLFPEFDKPGTITSPVSAGKGINPGTMSVLYIARASLYTNRGGDTIQILKTAEFLRRLGVGVDIRLTNEAFDYSGYHLLHFFNIIRPADILKHIPASGKPYLVSTVFTDYSEADAQTRKGWSRLPLALFSADRVEYLKVLARRLLNGERIVSPRYLFYGQRGSVRRILKGASLLLPNSENEYRRLVRRFGTTTAYRVIPNAIDPVIFQPGADLPPREDDLVICAGRIEGNKNQLNLIRAVNGSCFRLILIGSPATNQGRYYAECRRTAGPQVSFVHAVSQEELTAWYSRARVHVLPSWFETTGLSSLEAAAMGCSIVATDRGDTREYLGDQAIYCDPASPASILSALKKAAAETPPAPLREKILAQYTWAETAKQTLDAYRHVLDHL